MNAIYATVLEISWNSQTQDKPTIRSRFVRNADWEPNPELALEHDHCPDFERADPCDIFGGCRSHRAGIVKTLGAFALADLFFWPEKDILANTIKKTKDEPELDLLRPNETYVRRAHAGGLRCQRHVQSVRSVYTR